MEKISIAKQIFNLLQIEWENYGKYFIHKKLTYNNLTSTYLHFMSIYFHLSKQVSFMG